MPVDLFDLMIVHNVLREKGIYPDISGVIYQALSAHSALVDYRDSKSILELAFAQFADGSTILSQTKQIVVGSLFNDALIRYVRAAKTSSEARVNFRFQENWPDDLRNKHKELADLRDDAIAHFGHGPDANNYYAKETAVLVVAEGGVATAQFPFSRSNYREKYMNNLAEVLEASLGPIEKIASKKTELMLNKISDVTYLYEEFVRIITSSRFDPDGFFHNDEAKVAGFMQSAISGGSVFFGPTQSPAGD